MHQVFTPTRELCASVAQCRFLCSMTRKEHTTADKPFHTFHAIRTVLGSPLLALLKRSQMLVWKGDRLLVDEAKFEDVDFKLDGSECAAVSLREIEARVYYEPFFDRLQERLRGSYVPSVSRASSGCGLSAHELWGLS